jgi:type VI protein secretion system component Hcp
MAIYVWIKDVEGDCTIKGFEKCFLADSFSFGVEREMKESGEKGGTEDINIGVGELQECNISKTMDRASANLAQYAINGNSLGTAFIMFAEVGGPGKSGEGKSVIYLQYCLDRCFVKSWSTSGDADDRPTEEVAFYYNRIAFQYYSTEDGQSFKPAGEMKWDNVANTKEWGKNGPTFRPMGVAVG